jgi:methylmalonyl-CoA/ethylmalonyl-CoA epimerase
MKKTVSTGKTSRRSSNWEVQEIMLKKIRHIGIIVEDFEQAIEQFKGFGLACTEVVEVKEVGAKIAFMPVGATLLELIYHTRPAADEDKVGQVVRNQTGSINHLCFEVDDLEASIQDFQQNGAKLVEGCPKRGAHGRIAFMYPDTTAGVLIELCEV